MSVSPQVRESVDRYRDAFVNAQPFKHVMIEDFFDRPFAEQLLAEFPSFDKKLSINESGQTSLSANQHCSHQFTM